MLEGIAARNPKHSGAIASAVDHAWDGIGRTADKPG
jgi:hypothetical protein